MNIFIEITAKIKPWYQENFPSDELGEYLSDTVTFKDLFDGLLEHKDVYDVLCAGDSVVRERCFEQLSKILGCPYSYVYDQWLSERR